MSNIILCGFQHAGKTTIGKHLAAQLDKPFIDTDHLIANVYFKEHNPATARSLFQALGEANFRELEQDVIRGLRHTQNSVIATGGGSLLRQKNCALLKKIGKLIYVQWPMEVLKARILLHGPGAFLDAKNLDESFYDLYTHRHAIFLQASHVQIKMENETVEEANHKIFNFIQGNHYGQ